MGKKRGWLSDLMADVEKAVADATDNVTVNGEGNTVTHNTIIQSGRSTYVNGRKVSDDEVKTMHFGNGGVWINGKRID